MVSVVYGVWNNVVRGAGKDGAVSPEELVGIDFFNDGNPVQAFFGDKGFLVFDKNASLLDGLRLHMAKAADQTCGKCTPCRMGTKILLDHLDALRRGESSPERWSSIEKLAIQVQETSLCGLGQTCANALLGAVQHFRDVLEKETAAAAKKAAKEGSNGLSYMTAPCIEACPSKVDVPSYVSYIRDGKPTHSLGVILQKYPMAATCGRVCPHFCEMACRRNLVDDAVNIKTLKRYVADYQAKQATPLFTPSMRPEVIHHDKKVAVVGGGPGGIACAYHLLLKGYPVDVFESTDIAGGMAERGIPSYRLPKDVLKTETQIVETLGGKFLYNKALGRDFSVNSLFDQGYKSVFLAIGCANGVRIGAEGESPDLKGYDSGIDFLLKVHHHVDGTAPIKTDGVVVVVGGGNVAMDCARSAVRLGASEVHLIYRRTREDMPADKNEVVAAEEEGIIFHFLTNPTKVISNNGTLTGIELTDMKQTEPDKSGRRGVEAIAGSEKPLLCSLLISAIGQQIDREALKPEDGVKIDKRGLIEVDRKTQSTSRSGVFAGGDCSLGPTTLIHAMANGLRASRNIIDFIEHGELRFSPLLRIREIIRDNKLLTSDYIDVPVQPLVRVHHPELRPEVRREMFEEVEQNISCADAYKEAKRCMRCYRIYTVLTKDPIPGADTAKTSAHAAQ